MLRRTRIGHVPSDWLAGDMKHGLVDRVEKIASRAAPIQRSVSGVLGAGWRDMHQVTGDEAR